MELHVPVPFTTDRPAIAFDHTVHDVNIQSHPKAQHFPQPTEHATTQPVNDTLKEFLAPAGFPKTYKDFVQQEWPQLTLFVTSFNDATLVTVIWPHYLMDACGHEALMRNWVRVLAGREGEVETVLGASEDVLNFIDESKAKDQEPLYLEPQRMSTLQIILFVLIFIWRKLTSPKPEARMIYLPDITYAKLKKRTLAEAQTTARITGQDPFVTDGDILTTWPAHAVMQANPLKPRPLNIFDIVDARRRLPGVSEAQGVYLQNVVFLANDIYTAEEASGSPGALALVHRRELARQASQAQTWANLRTIRDALHAGKKLLPFFGSPNSRVVFSNNVAKSDFIGITDFSSAVICQGQKSESRKNPAGTMVSYYNCPTHKSLDMIGFCYNWGKDHSKGHWLMCNAEPKAWELLEQDLRSLQA